MAPKGEWKYFFTSSLNQVKLNEDEKVVKLSRMQTMNFVYDKNQKKNTDCTFEISEMNVVEVAEIENDLDF